MKKTRLFKRYLHRYQSASVRRGSDCIGFRQEDLAGDLM
jgi:hypothetical protein